MIKSPAAETESGIPPYSHWYSQDVRRWHVSTYFGRQLPSVQAVSDGSGARLLIRRFGRISKARRSRVSLSGVGIFRFLLLVRTRQSGGIGLDALTKDEQGKRLNLVHVDFTELFERPDVDLPLRPEPLDVSGGCPAHRLTGRRPVRTWGRQRT